MSPPALSPPALKFVIVDFSITCGVMQLTFWCKTDVACHLYLHLAKLKPIFRRIPARRRGADVNLSSLTCFVEVEIVEQDEAGDTYEHTFIVPLTAYDEWHYWYLTGTQGGVPMTSVSQIFKGICGIPPPPPVTLYFYPDAHPEVSSVDGDIYRFATETWAQLHDRPGMVANDTAGSLSTTIWASNQANKWMAIYRDILLFDTSIIPAGATILSARLRLYCFDKTLVGVPLASLAIYGSSPASNTAVVPVDYQALGFIDFSNPIPWAGITENAYNYINLNPSGLAAIAPAGITKLGLREATYDGPNVEPPWTSRAYASWRFRSADVGGAQRPRLKVVYTPPP